MVSRAFRIVLASRSPRRIEILQREGVQFQSIEADVDDEATPPAGDPRSVAKELALSKARAVSAAHALQCQGAFVIGADTICHHRGVSVGKARDRDEARQILFQMMDGAHTVVTGIAIIHDGDARTFVDEAIVRLQPVSDAQIELYLQSDGWQGKAGAYDIEERQRAGWSMQCDGDTDTVGGLPWRRVREAIEGWSA